MRGPARVLLVAGLSSAIPCQSFGARDDLELSEIQEAIRAGDVGWIAGETSASRLAPEERRALLGVRIDPASAEGVTPAALPPLDALPRRLDWRDYNGGNYVTPVKNQRGCGSCWAFAATAALESYVLRTRNMPGRPLGLSEQMLLACSGVGGCQGGSPYTAAAFIMKNGLPPEGAAPYTATEDCELTPNLRFEKRLYRIGSPLKVPRDEAAIKAALLGYGPLSTVMTVYNDFFYYRAGIYRRDPRRFLDSHERLQDRKVGPHAVLIIGYDDDEQAFIAKNSWGERWGEAGYFRIAYSAVNDAIQFGDHTLAFSEHTAPILDSLEVTSPVDGAKVGGVTKIEGRVSGSDAVFIHVDQVSQGGVWVFDDRWRYALDTSLLADGWHTVKVQSRAYERHGINQEKLITVFVDNRR